MKNIACLVVFAALLINAGCMLYTDSPPHRTISGQVVRVDNGEAVPFATVLFYSGRKHIGMASKHGVDASAQADKDGRFSLHGAQLKDKVSVCIVKDGHMQFFDLQPFPESNVLEDVVFRLDYTKKSQQETVVAR